METDPPQPVEVVDPEVRAYVYSLVTALGGTAGDEFGRYVPGDDALGCLSDLRKWLRFYDHKLNRLDVARCLAERQLVNGDLVPIMCLYADADPSDKHKARIMLACLELLVPLTWPVEIHSQMTVNHHRHTPYLQFAQVEYKRGILGCTDTPILRAIIRVGLPSMAVPRSERSSKDEGIIRIMLYFFRNIAITTPPNVPADGDDDKATRSATINAFQEQDVFALLLTMCSTMGEDFIYEDVILLEILFHLVKGVDVKQLFKHSTRDGTAKTNELQDLLQKESQLDREYAKTAPTRHGRFGTMIWVKRDDEKLSTVSGQDVMKGERAAFLKMDQSKKWNKPRIKREVVDPSSNNFNLKVTLTQSAAKHLRTFVEEFLDSGFNPLFTHLRKAIQREAERVTDSTSRHFWYVISWCLEAERARREHQKEARRRSKGTSREIEPDSFSLVAGVLNQETFVALNSYMQHSMDYKDWQDLTAGMKCFTQILLTVQEMAVSPLDEDQEIAENIQSRIFYEETTHEKVLFILRNYKDQGFWYLDACTELAHVFLRMLEQYSKQNVDMQIRSRRRARRKKTRKADSNQDDGDEDGANDSENEDIAAANRTAVERSFDFKRFSARFCTQKSVDTFIALTNYYRELDSEQLKRAHRFFYRVAFKQEMSVLLFRVDIISLFFKMIKGPEGLDPSKAIFKEWEELIRQIFKKLVRKLQQRPELIVEMLFSKINATVFYLEYGYEKQTLSSESRPAAELEIKPGSASTLDEKIHIVVTALLRAGKQELVKWLCQVLDSAASERLSWEMEAEARAASSTEERTERSLAPSIAVVAADDACRTAMFRNAQLRLLMKISGLECLGEDVHGASWIISSSVPSSTLRETHDLIKKHCDNPAEDIDGVDPRDLLRRKRTTDSETSRHEGTEHVDFGSGSEGEEDGILFPPNLPERLKALRALKQKRRKRRKDGDEDDDDGPDEELLEARRRARERNALARQRKIKSDLYVHASDDESDADADVEFFAQEETRRQAQARRVHEALQTDALEEIASNKQQNVGAGRKRKAKPILDSDDEESEDSQPKRQRGNPAIESDSDDALMVGLESTSPRHSQTPPTSADNDFGLDKSPSPAFPFSVGVDKMMAKLQDLTSSNKGERQGDDDHDDSDDGPATGTTRRRRAMAGFVIDSDSE
ncbi:Topoisomerase 1-associated factor 1 [Emydomyces testavorans]|uniref:Topoisomerase 1-associated factor 1 n=1 Tax=Emydomyces testavorans TaxID=2070801 RepID=A0AAF0IK62_9EURO|nr:Topoisomerase 1-associated factor 1 [Emydomyces testavorans]